MTNRRVSVPIPTRGVSRSVVVVGSSGKSELGHKNKCCKSPSDDFDLPSPNKLHKHLNISISSIRLDGGHLEVELSRIQNS